MGQLRAQGRPSLFQPPGDLLQLPPGAIDALTAGDTLWLVSRSPTDQQYYFVARLVIAAQRQNAPDEPNAQFGEFSVVADRKKSRDLARTFPAEGLLRALQFESGRPIKHGASIGQSLQTIRFLNDADDAILNALFNRLQSEGAVSDSPFGLWTKCDRIFADYFLKDWNTRRKPVAFLLYDSPPQLTSSAPVFVHSDKYIRLVARFRESQYVAGHKFTVDTAERNSERDRIWNAWRAESINPPDKAEFDAFWIRQNGIRSLIVLDELHEVPTPCQFKEYSRTLEWGYPTGVGYRYLTLSQSYLLLREIRCSNVLDAFISSQPR